MTTFIKPKRPKPRPIMNLRKDALLAVSLAGAIMIAVAVTTKIGRAHSVPATLSGRSVQDPELSRLFADFERMGRTTDIEELENGMILARAKALEIYNARKLRGSVDYFRMAKILQTSTDPLELDLANRLSRVALAAGVEQAREVVLESQDRLLLSMGQDQRYSTQSEREGKRLKPVEDDGTASQTTVEEEKMRSAAAVE